MKTVDENIYIGNNAAENWKLIENAYPEDYWFHIASLPSCHVICNDVSKVQQCALLCKQHSKYKNFTSIKVAYTQVKNLSKGKEIGSVIYKSKRKVELIKV